MSEWLNLDEDKTNPGSLQPQELEAVYAISRRVAEAEDTETALDEIVRIIRPVFIFDNMVLYICSQDDETLEPSFARAIGRGRFREADLAWGESTAQRTYREQQVVTQVEQLQGAEGDRTNLRYSLGLPVHLRGQTFGALVFIRFGGPTYLPEHIHLAEFVAQHVAQLLQRHQLVARIAELEARRRLDMLQDDFISTISHELLTPLGFIKGYTTTLLREDITWDEGTRREFLAIINEESDRLRELIDNLLDSSRLQAGTLRMNFQTIRLDAMLKDISLRARSRNENLSVELALKANNVQVRADPARLAQVFDNILNNAIKYAPNSPVQISLERKDQMATVAISDQGPGIAPQHLDKLFQRFYRVPESSSATRGTGLGLYICRKIIQAHNGEITAESTLGAGTTFYIRLPLIANP
jgi:signal transduction histidine kinase